MKGLGFDSEKDQKSKESPERIKRTYYVNKDTDKRMKLICIDHGDRFPELSIFVEEAINRLCDRYE